LFTTNRDGHYQDGFDIIQETAIEKSLFQPQAECDRE